MVVLTSRMSQMHRERCWWTLRVDYGIRSCVNSSKYRPVCCQRFDRAQRCMARLPKDRYRAVRYRVAWAINRLHWSANNVCWPARRRPHTAPAVFCSIIQVSWVDLASARTFHNIWLCFFRGQVCQASYQPRGCSQRSPINLAQKLSQCMR